MALKDMLNDCKKTFENIMRNRKYKKARLEREAQVELLHEIGKCNGKLNVCLNSFKNAIAEQSRSIIEANGEYDTLPQEQILWDSAIGYLLVKDAAFALKSVSSYNSLTHAYDLLNKAVRQISGTKNKTLSNTAKGSSVRDETYGYLSSDETIKNKMLILDGFFEELKTSGDIEACLEKRRNAKQENGHSANYNSAPSSGAAKSQLDSFYDDMEDDDDVVYNVDDLAERAIQNVKPPVTDSEEG